MSNSKNVPDLIAYQVTKSGDRSFWNRIGAAWSNKAGGINVRLTSLPIDGELILLPPRAEGENKSEDAGA